ncbi:hypothetical protein AOQ84DRAFT_266184, partial [Glonium stellatum]
VVTQETSDITALLRGYASALNASSTSAAMSLYASNGVFMPQHFLSIVESDDIRETYDKIFQIITLHVKMEVKEIVVITPEWGFARTTATGTQ